MLIGIESGKNEWEVAAIEIGVEGGERKEMKIGRIFGFLDILVERFFCERGVFQCLSTAQGLKALNKGGLDVEVEYFEAHGRAEPIRMMLFISGVEYRNKYVSQQEWGTLK